MPHRTWFKTLDQFVCFSCATCLLDQRCSASITSVIQRIDTFTVVALLDLQPYSVGLCETHPLTAERILSIIDRRRSDGGIGTCTSMEKEHGSGSWLRRPQTHTDRTGTLPSGNQYSLAARLFSALSGPARMTCMTMDADQSHPPPGDGRVATADERRNVAGLDNVMNVLQSSPLEKKLHARKNEILHAFFRDDSLARTKGEPIAMWLVRYNEQLGKLNRVGLDIVTSLPDVAGWQTLNLAGLTEDRIERVVSRLLDDTFPLDAISVELNHVFASMHMSEHVFSIPAIPPGRAWSSNERERVLRVLIIAGDSPDPH